MKSTLHKIIFLGLLVAILASSYVFLFKVAEEKRQTLRQETAAKQKALADYRQATSGIADLSDKIAKLQEAINFFESKLPQEKEVDEILRQVSQIAQVNSLTVKTVKPLKIDRSANYSEQPIEMTLAGGFHSFYAFLLQLEKLPRITRMTQMKIEKAQKDGDMQAHVTLSIFFEPDSNHQMADVR